MVINAKGEVTPFESMRARYWTAVEHISMDRGFASVLEQPERELHVSIPIVKPDRILNGPEHFQLQISHTRNIV